MSETPEPLTASHLHPEPQLAELAEIIAVLNGLPDVALIKLESYGSFLMVGVRGRFSHADAEDLLHEAIARTLDGRRKWNPQKIDFVLHLKGCMRSIADEWIQKADREVALNPETELASVEFNDGYPSEEIIRFTRRRLRFDVVALAVLDALYAGEFPAEIQVLLNISEKVYNAARKRIFRCMYSIVCELPERKKATPPNHRHDEGDVGPS
jgi:DNA-directed RNA polymerase specialized sigma24 family protein